MNSSTPVITFPALTQLKEGMYKIKAHWWRFPSARKGWVSIEREKDETEIMWCSDRTTHDPHVGPARSVTLSKRGTVKYYSRSALSMWLVWDGCYRKDPEEYKAALQFCEWCQTVLTDPKQHQWEVPKMIAENKKPITPEEFEVRMREIADDHTGDNEAAHSYMDQLMEQTLISLGYGKGVEIFRNQDRRYA